MDRLRAPSFSGKPMTDPSADMLAAFECHDLDALVFALKRGASATEPIRGKLPINWLLEEYFRSERLPNCLRLLLDYGARFSDPLVGPVLLDDGEAVRSLMKANPDLLSHSVSMTSAFTSLAGVSLLHVAAEYGNLQAAMALLEAGADVNARADLDAWGLNGHTPLFHSVNTAFNRGLPLMKRLLESGARTDVRLAGIHWGKGYPWETVFFDVTPFSYAQMGLMPQMHRREVDIYGNLVELLRASGRPVPPMPNVPNQYLKPKSGGKES